MMNQTIVTCFLLVVNDEFNHEINQNAEHNEYIKWWVEGQCLQKWKYITQTVELAESFIMELQVCQFGRKIWQSKIKIADLTLCLQDDFSMFAGKINFI